MNYSNSEGPVTSVIKAVRAFLISLVLIDFSSSLATVGLPTGYGIATVGTILFAPTDFDIVVIVAICTIGMPYLSISLTIVAPQRVQVPHVDVRITPSTPASFSSLPISVPNFIALPTDVPVPVVV